MRYLGLILISLSLLAASCGKNQTGTVELTFKATHEGQPLVMFQKYATEDGRGVTYKVLEFFISEVNLIKTDGSIVNLTDVDYVKFNELQDQAAAEQGITLTFPELETDDFEGISFGIGVKPSLNATEPGDYTTETQMGNSSNYWTAWDSYIFSRFEGDYFDANDEATPFLYHAGVDGSYQALSFDKNFAITKGETTTLNFELQAEDIIFREGKEIDVPNGKVSHSGAVGTPEYELALSSIANMAAAIRLE